MYISKYILSQNYDKMLALLQLKKFFFRSVVATINVVCIVAKTGLPFLIFGLDSSHRLKLCEKKIMWFIMWSVMLRIKSFMTFLVDAVTLDFSPVFCNGLQC